VIVLTPTTRQQLQEQTPVGGGGVDPGITDGAEADAPPGEQVERIQEMREGAPEPVELPDKQVLELPGLRGLHHRVEARPRRGRTAHALIDVLGHEVESTVSGDGAKLVYLEADVLAVVRGGDAGVEGGSGGLHRDRYVDAGAI
jgi:hypothetical protein